MRSASWLFWLYFLLPLIGLFGGPSADVDVELLNVSYDPTRELYRHVNRAFADRYFAETGRRVRVRMSHGGSSSQANLVINGLPADMATLALWTDIDAIRRRGRIDAGWQDELPNRALPYSSTIVFVVRNGNPKGIRDWPDLARPGVSVVTANPKTGGGAKLAFLGAWGSVLRRGGTEADARDFVTRLYRNAPVRDSGARGATVTFARKRIGDVHLTWENEARLELDESRGELEIVYPPLSIKAEPYVALIGANARQRGTENVAREYLKFLYTREGQEIVARQYYRPLDPAVAAVHVDRFPPIDLFTVDQIVAGGWAKVNRQFFANGGVFDQIDTPQ
jgi:sulfate transport system substrate-binding protein